MFKESVFQVLKAVAAAVIFSLAYVLIFTFIVRAASLGSSVIKPVNQIFKILAIVGGCLIFIRGEKGYIKGAVAGAVSVIFCYILFGIIGGSFAIKWTFLLEILLGGAAGLVSGVIAVNVKKA